MGSPGGKFGKLKSKQGVKAGKTLNTGDMFEEGEQN